MTKLLNGLPYETCSECLGTGDAQESHGSAPFCVVCFGSGNEPIFDPRRYAFARATGTAPRDAQSGNSGSAAGNKFANKFGGKCFRCGQWVEERQGLCTRDGQKWVVEHSGECPAVEHTVKAVPAPTGLDLSSVPSGRYAVPGGDTRLKVQIQGVSGGKWDGWVFVKDAAEYGQQTRYGSQRPGETYRGKIEDALRAIAADPKAAAAAYGHLVGRCCICNRKLEDEGSVEAGIGPICLAKFGA